MGRAERRRLERETLKQMLKDTDSQVKTALYRNGITGRDLIKEYNRGFEEGIKTGHENAANMIFAAVMLALHDCYGFAGVRCLRVLEKAYDHIINDLTTEDIIQEVYDTIGVEIVMDDPIEPVRKKKGAKKRVKFK